MKFQSHSIAILFTLFCGAIFFLSTGNGLPALAAKNFAQSVMPSADGSQAPLTAPMEETNAPVTSFPSCVNTDPNHLCLGLKIVSYESNQAPVLNERQALSLVNGINSIWSQCNIAFQIESFEVIDSAAEGLPYSPDWETQTNTVRQHFSDASHFLITAVGPWTASTIAVTMMPGSGIYGTIVDQQYAQNPLTVGHELGHYQGLYHGGNSENLMSPYIGSNTHTITADQCSVARTTDQTEWQKMLRASL